MSRPSAPSEVRVVLFSGGRGSGALAELLASDARIALTVAINGYDDGASTGEVRRFLGDALGPSDFRKNAARLARLRKTASPALIDLLERRLSATATFEDVETIASSLTGHAPPPFAAATAAAVAERLRRFEEEYRRGERPFKFDDCSVGNLVFAGSFLGSGRDFNRAVDDYCALLGLGPGLVENVTDGRNAFLVAIDSHDRLLGSEEAIVDAKRRNAIKDLFLVDRPIASGEAAADPEALVGMLRAHAVQPRVNARLAARLTAADLIIYAPGTQHSSLFPSYLTAGLTEVIAGNLKAIKLLVTNIQEDAEIAGSSAVDLIDRAVFYLRGKGQVAVPAPCLITHYLLNDPRSTDSGVPYVPLGSLESLEDPRLVRVGNYEQGVTGRHDATKVLGPFVDAFVARREGLQRVAVMLCDTRSPTQVAQTILEMIRGGIASLPVAVTVFHECAEELEPSFIRRIGFPVRRLAGSDADRDAALRRALVDERFDYLTLFDSSGMYNGEDIAGLAGHLRLGRLDAVWGSRRLSARDVHESYRVKYRKNALMGAVSAAGSHALSLLYLVLYSRYVSDTLSAAWTVRASDAAALSCRITDKLANHYLLPALLRRRAEMLEIPVQFFAISPERVRRTTMTDGLRAVAAGIAGRFSRRDAPPVSSGTTEDAPESRAWTGS